MMISRNSTPDPSRSSTGSASPLPSGRLPKEGPPPPGALSLCWLRLRSKAVTRASGFDMMEA